MKERPILFSAPMVCALLDGRKTQTRRIVKHEAAADICTEATWNAQKAHAAMAVPQHRFLDHDGRAFALLCPYGRPGDRLWVRETFAIEHSVEPDQPPPHNDGRPIQRRPVDDYECAHPLWRQAHYRATDPAPELVYEEGPAGGREDEIGVRWKPSIHMPRWASRITLEITAVRVERLQSISKADARAEGSAGHPDGPWHAFRSLWTLINGAASWKSDPLVWVVEFQRLPIPSQGT